MMAPLNCIPTALLLNEKLCLFITYLVFRSQYQPLDQSAGREAESSKLQTSNQSVHRQRERERLWTQWLGFTWFKRLCLPLNTSDRCAAIFNELLRNIHLIERIFTWQCVMIGTWGSFQLKYAPFWPAFLSSLLSFERYALGLNAWKIWKDSGQRSLKLRNWCEGASPKPHDITSRANTDFSYGRKRLECSQSKG